MYFTVYKLHNVCFYVNTVNAVAAVQIRSKLPQIYQYFYEDFGLSMTIIAQSLIICRYFYVLLEISIWVKMFLFAVIKLAYSEE